MISFRFENAQSLEKSVTAVADNYYAVAVK